VILRSVLVFIECSPNSTVSAPNSFVDNLFFVFILSPDSTVNALNIPSPSFNLHILYLLPLLLALGFARALIADLGCQDLT